MQERSPHDIMGTSFFFPYSSYFLHLALLDFLRKSFCHREHREKELFSKVSVDSVAKQRVTYARGLLFRDCDRLDYIALEIRILIRVAPRNTVDHIHPF